MAAAGHPTQDDAAAVANVSNAISGIDDNGNITVAYSRYEGGQYVVYVSRGSAGGAGVAPQWTAPVSLPIPGGATLQGAVPGSGNGISVSPNGNVALWVVSNAAQTACGLNGGYLCKSIYVTRYLAATGGWEAPSLAAQVQSLTSGVINDNGDVALLATLPPDATANYSHFAVAWRPNNASAFSQQGFTLATSITATSLAMDTQGNMLFGGQDTTVAGYPVVAIRGTQNAGFGAKQVLSTAGVVGSSYPGLQAVRVGVNGQQVIVWEQTNGQANTSYAAVSSSATGNFAIQDLGHLYAIQSFAGLTALDDGSIQAIDFLTGERTRFVSGQWQAQSSLDPTMLYWFGRMACAQARNAGVMCFNTSFNPLAMWLTYDAASNSMVETPPATPPSGTTATGPAWVFGTSAAAFGNPRSTPLTLKPLLSTSGIGAMMLVGDYATLPTAAVPLVAGGSTVHVWGLYMK